MRVNLRAVAQAAGVNVATASRALRGLGNVTPETARRVEEAAARLGYTRDPQISRALSFIRQPVKPIYRETIALLVERDIPEPGAISGAWLRAIHQGASSRAEALGYALEVHRLERGKASQRQLGKMLFARGIRGLLIAPVTLWQPAILHVNPGPFAIVQVNSNTIWRPRLHRVEGDFYNDLVQAIHRLKQRGYRRLGLVIDRKFQRIRRWSPRAALLVVQQLSGDMPALPPLDERWPWTLEGFSRWLEEARPDAIITNGESVPLWLKSLGRRVPEDIGILRTDAAVDPGLSGIAMDHHYASARAVDLLANLLETGVFGLPDRIQCLLISHQWQEGRTLRPRPGADTSGEKSSLRLQRGGNGAR
jgi:LacI family transcriptional regulator